MQVFPKDTDSGVPAQPKDEQILQGAINRAKAALEGNDFGVGIEGGIVEINGKLCNTAYCVIMDRTGKYSVGSQLIFELLRYSEKKFCQEKSSELWLTNISRRRTLSMRAAQ